MKNLSFEVLLNALSEYQRHPKPESHFFLFN